MQNTRTPQIGFGTSPNKNLDDYNFNNGETIKIENDGHPSTAPV